MNASYQSDIFYGYPGMSSDSLEYRAKLVELIYSEQRNLLTAFLHEADDSGKGRGHSAASARIITDILPSLGIKAEDISLCSTEQIRPAARTLFKKSCEKIQAKYALRQ